MAKCATHVFKCATHVLYVFVYICQLAKNKLHVLHMSRSTCVSHMWYTMTCTTHDCKLNTCVDFMLRKHSCLLLQPGLM